MIETTGDLWAAPCDARVITTNGTRKVNGRGVMGRGVAWQAAQRYPAMAIRLGEHLKRSGNHVGILFEPPRGPEEWALVVFPVKHQWSDDADLGLIERSAGELVALADRKGWKQVALPRPGCGNGRRSWEEVRFRIAPILDERFTVVNL